MKNVGSTQEEELVGVYTPKNMPTVVLEYSYIPDPNPLMVWIDKIKVNGDYVSDPLFKILMEQHQINWVCEIMDTLNGKENKKEIEKIYTTWVGDIEPSEKESKKQ